MLSGNIIDQLFDQYGLSYTRTPEKTRLAATSIGLHQVNHLDACLEHLC